MQPSVVPQVGVVQTVLGFFAVVPEGQEKLTLPQVALTVCEDTQSHTHNDFSRCPLSSWAVMGRAALRRAANRQTTKNKKERKKKRKKKNKKGIRKAARTESSIELPAGQSRKLKERKERASKGRTSAAV